MQQRKKLYFYFIAVSCEVGNGGCQHTCTQISEYTVSCTCAPQYRLQTNNRQEGLCESKGYLIHEYIHFLKFLQTLFNVAVVNVIETSRQLQF